MARNKIFLGNCTDELIEHRSKVHEILCNVDSDWMCVWGEDVEVDDASEKYQESQSLIQASELCIFLVGHLYTSDVLRNGMPLYMAEFHLAEETKKDILAFVASDRFTIQARHLRSIASVDSLKKQREFRNAVQKKGNAGFVNVTVVMFNTLGDLLRKVEVEFHKWLRAKNISIQNKFLNDEVLTSIIPKFSLSPSFQNSLPLFQLTAFTSLLSTNAGAATRSERRTIMNAQDIIPYMPVIVEATKFVLNEVSKWIDEVRKKSSTPSNPVDVSLDTISNHDLNNASENPEYLLSFINSSFDVSNLQEIQSLVRQVQRYRLVLNNLEEGVITASGSEGAKIKTEISEISGEIVIKVKRLTDLLKQVYKNSSVKDIQAEKNQEKKS